MVMKRIDENDLKPDEESGKGFLRRNSDEIFIGIVLLLQLVLIPIILFLPRALQSSGGSFHKYEVLDVIDGKTLKVHLLEFEKGVHEGGNEMELMGIWSDEDQEPETLYQNRLQFFRQRLVGQTIQGQVTFYVVDPNPPEPPSGLGDNSLGRPGPSRIRQPIMLFKTPQRPSEVRLNERASLNQLLLANGYAAFDFTDRFLGKNDRARYEAAEAQARTARLGVWSSPELSQKYITAREAFERKERLQRAGLGFYLLTQALLIAVTVILMYVSRKNYGQASFVAVSKLLAIPGVLLLVVFLRLIWTRPFKAEDPNTQMLYGFYLFTVSAIFLWGLKQFFTLVALGPLREWQILWKSSKAKRAIWVFLLGLGISILLFTILYRFAGGIDSLPASLRISLSQTLNLGYPLPKTAAFGNVVLAQSVLLRLWPFLCAAFVPGLKEERAANLSLSNAIFTSLISVVLLVLVIASVFANIFYYNIQLEGFSRPLDLAECFFLALFTSIGKSYGDVYPTSGWMVIAQSLEVLLVMLLQLVALRFILSSVTRAVEARNEG